MTSGLKCRATPPRPSMNPPLTRTASGYVAKVVGHHHCDRRKGSDRTPDSTGEENMRYAVGLRRRVLPTRRGAGGVGDSGARNPTARWRIAARARAGPKWMAGDEATLGPRNGPVTSVPEHVTVGRSGPPAGHDRGGGPARQNRVVVRCTSQTSARAASTRRSDRATKVQPIDTARLGGPVDRRSLPRLHAGDITPPVVRVPDGPSSERSGGQPDEDQWRSGCRRRVGGARHYHGAGGAPRCAPQPAEHDQSATPMMQRQQAPGNVAEVARRQS